MARAGQRSASADVRGGALWLSEVAVQAGFGKNFQTKRVVKRELDDQVSEEEHFEFPQNDRAVRAKIPGIVAQRLMSKGDGWQPRPWAQLSLDFTDAHLVDAYFFSSVFPELMIFRRTRFEGMAVFARARFKLAIFEQCTFGSGSLKWPRSGGLSWTQSTLIR